METRITQTGSTTAPDLRKLRERYGLSQKSVAERAGIKQVRLCKLERGYWKMNPADEAAVVRALDELRSERLNALIGVTS